MKIIDYLREEWVIPDLQGTDKQSILRELSEVLVKPCQAASVEELLQVLLDREKLGSTGIGEGIAIPHGRLPGLARLQGLFVRVDPAVDFDAVDEQPVDLVFLLLAPEGAGADHLKALARVSRLLRYRQICEKLRGAESADALYALLTEAQTSHAA